MNDILRKVAGVVLIVMGVVLIPVPILPGIPLVIAGLALVGTDHPLLRKSWNWLQNRVKLR
jgi:uncharacterized protein YqgC (DUF456 family)